MTSEAPTSLLITARAAAELCGKSLRTWQTWDAAGLIPRAMRIGRSRLWRVDELRAWITADCPRRDVWEESAERRGLTLSSGPTRGNS